MTRCALLHTAITMLSGAGIANARQESLWILEEALGLSRLDLYVHPDESVPAADVERVRAMLERRKAGEPLQYVLGSQEFYGLTFAVRPGVLIPRPETELLVEEALAHARAWDRPLVLDVGTGSGCLAVALAKELPEAMIVALDRSADAIAVARDNAGRHEVARRVKFVVGDLLAHLSSENLTGKVAVAVANLPYIREDEWDTLPREVRDFEPRLALSGGPDGLVLYRRLIREMGDAMPPGGALIVEVGMGQARRLCHERPWGHAFRVHGIRTDVQGIERMLCLVRV